MRLRKVPGHHKVYGIHAKHRQGVMTPRAPSCVLQTSDKLFFVLCFLFSHVLWNGLVRTLRICLFLHDNVLTGVRLGSPVNHRNLRSARLIDYCVCLLHTRCTLSRSWPTAWPSKPSPSHQISSRWSFFRLRPLDISPNCVHPRGVARIHQACTGMYYTLQLL